MKSADFIEIKPLAAQGTILENREIVRPHVMHHSLDSGYAEMARDHKREKDAFEWAEITFKNVDMTWPKTMLPT